MKRLNLPNPPVQKILLIRLRNIGDVLLMVPMIRAFREAFPEAHLAALVNAGTEEMLTGNPLLNEVLVFDPRWKTMPLLERVAKEGRFVWGVRKRRFDLAVNTTEGDRGAFLCLRRGARIKVGLYDPRAGYGGRAGFTTAWCGLRIGNPTWWSRCWKFPAAWA